jgi:hypothetical protein
VTVGRAGHPQFSLSHPDEQAETDMTTNITSAPAIAWPREVGTSRMVDGFSLVSPTRAAGLLRPVIGCAHIRAVRPTQCPLPGGNRVVSRTTGRDSPRA